MKLTLKVYKTVIKEHKLEETFILSNPWVVILLCAFGFLYNIMKEGKLHSFEMFKEKYLL